MSDHENRFSGNITSPVFSEEYSCMILTTQSSHKSRKVTSTENQTIRLSTNAPVTIISVKGYIVLASLHLDKYVWLGSVVPAASRLKTDFWWPREDGNSKDIAKLPPSSLTSSSWPFWSRKIARTCIISSKFTDISQLYKILCFVLVKNLIVAKSTVYVSTKEYLVASTVSAWTARIKRITKTMSNSNNKDAGSGMQTTILPKRKKEQ